MASTKELKWVNSPPRSPHHGGLWEEAVREMKHLLRKMVSPHPLRYDEFATLLVDVEATLNSWPLVESGSTEPDDDLSVTLSHFLIFRPVKALPSSQSARPSCPTSGDGSWSNGSYKISGMHGRDSTLHNYRDVPDGGKITPPTLQ